MWFSERYRAVVYAVTRVAVGLLFMTHGAQKLLGWFGGFGGEPGGTADLFSQMGLAGVLELFGGALIAIGLFTQPVALVLLLEMLVAYFQVHLPQGVWPLQQGGGETALLYAALFLMYSGLGAGRYSLDARMGRGGRIVAVPEDGAEPERRRAA